MPSLDQLSGRKIMRALAELGYKPVRQKGSHVRMLNKEEPGKKPITVPDHKVVGRGLLQKILRDVEINAEDFEKLL